MAWTWSPLGDNTALNDRMRGLQAYLGLSEKQRPTQSVTRTTDATVTTLHTQAIPVNTTVQVEGWVTARRTGGSGGSANDGAGYVVRFVAKNTAGTAALIGSASVSVIGESQAGWDVTVSASSGNILVQVTGAANNAVTWIWSGLKLAVTE